MNRERARHAIEVIERQLGLLDDILQSAPVRRPYESSFVGAEALQAFEEWRDETTQLLRIHVGEQAARRFRSSGPGLVPAGGGRPLIQTYVEFYGGRLKALRDRIHRSPETVFLADNPGRGTASEKIEGGESVVAIKLTCFVLMPFGSPYDDYYRRVIAPAITATGLEPIRADEINQPGSIVNQIWREIKQASVCVAELTGRNANVMYELGLAHALHKPVVQIVQSADDLPFDLKHLRTIVYRTTSVDWAEDLSRRLQATLRAALQDPRESVAFRDEQFDDRVKQQAAAEGGVKVTIAAAIAAPVPGQTVSVLSLEAANVGFRPVSLTSVGLRFSNDKQMVFPRPVHQPPFPVYLREGEGCKVLVSARDVRDGLQREGLMGKVDIVAFYRDALGNMYESASTMFDIEGFLARD